MGVFRTLLEPPQLDEAEAIPRDSTVKRQKLLKSNKSDMSTIRQHVNQLRSDTARREYQLWGAMGPAHQTAFCKPLEASNQGSMPGSSADQARHWGIHLVDGEWVQVRAKPKQPPTAPPSHRMDQAKAMSKQANLELLEATTTALKAPLMTYRNSSGEEVAPSDLLGALSYSVEVKESAWAAQFESDDPMHTSHLF